MPQKDLEINFEKNLEMGIENSKNSSLVKVIFSLGIPQLGIRNAKLFANYVVNEFSEFKDIDFIKLSQIKDIGPITISELQEFLNKESNLKLINYLISIGINPQREFVNIEENIFKGKKISITGSFKMNRNEIVDIIETRGGTWINSISKNIDYLLVGQNSGSKLDKAKKLGIEIITEDEFEEIIK